MFVKGLGIVHVAVITGQIIEIGRRSGMKCRPYAVETGIIDRAFWQALEFVRLLFHVHLERHAYFEPLPQNTGNYFPIFLIIRLPFYERGHDDDIFKLFPRILHFWHYGENFSDEIVSHYLYRRRSRRGNWHEVRVRKEIPFWSRVLEIRIIKKWEAFIKKRGNLFYCKSFRHSKPDRLDVVPTLMDTPGDEKGILGSLHIILAGFHISFSAEKYSGSAKPKGRAYDILFL